MASVSTCLLQNNKGSEKIAMTSPVQMQLSDSAGRVEDKCAVHMSFVMPSKYTMETLPKPNNKDISIKEVGAGLHCLH